MSLTIIKSKDSVDGNSLNLNKPDKKPYKPWTKKEKIKPSVNDDFKAWSIENL